MRFVAYQCSQVTYRRLIDLAKIQEECRQKTGKKPVSLKQLATAYGKSKETVREILDIGGSVNLGEAPLLQWRPDNHYRSAIYDNPLFGRHEQKMERRASR